MPQLHCYVPDDVAASLKRRADSAGVSVSRYLAQLAKNDLANDWPADYFKDVFGQPDIAPIDRQPQGDFEQRAALDG